MRLQMLASAFALIGSSAAFSDSSPWVLLSTSSLGNEDVANSNTIQTSSQVLDFTKKALQSCPTQRYLLVNQPGVTSLDLRGSSDCSLPHLCRAVDDSRISGKFVVSEVVGDVSDSGLERFIKDACSENEDAVVEVLDLSSPTSSDRDGALAVNDVILGKKLESVTADDSYSIVFFSTPGEPSYEAEFTNPVQLELKRGVQKSKARRDEPDTRSLFEKYQFFTPGIFMGLIVSIFLVSILAVGVSALGSLEVSYGAFEKDMGPAAQKKQQ